MGVPQASGSQQSSLPGDVFPHCCGTMLQTLSVGPDLPGQGRGQLDGPQSPEVRSAGEEATSAAGARGACRELLVVRGWWHGGRSTGPDVDLRGGSPSERHVFLGLLLCGLCEGPPAQCPRLVK